MNRSLIVTAKTNPDLDGVACAVAYAELLEATSTPATAVVAGIPDAEARFVLEHLGIRLPTCPPGAVEGVVLVDMSALPGLPSFVEPAAVVEVIDHRNHGDPKKCFPRAAIQIAAVGAAATLVYERFEAAHVTPSAGASLLLQAAIHSNTQKLRGAVTTPRDITAAASLAACQPLPPRFIEAQFQARAAEIVADLPAALERETKTFDHGTGGFQVAQLECPGALNLLSQARLLTARPRLILNLVDPELPASLILVHDPEFRTWVADRAGVSFDEDIARPDRVLLRKQLVARLMRAGGHS